MLPDPKKIALAIVAKGKPPPAADDSGDSLDAAAQDFLDALDKHSPKDVADAFRAMLNLADDDSGDSPKDE